MFRPTDLNSPEDISKRSEMRARFDGGDQECKIVLAVGRLAARKGYGTLIRGIFEAPEENSQHKTRHSGKGALEVKTIEAGA